MTSAPFFPLYLKDWVMDTKGFTHEDKGVLVDLLCMAWERGGLPLNPDAIRKLTGCTKGAWGRVWPTVQAHWVERDGVLIYPKLEAARHNLERRSKAGQRGAAARWIASKSQCDGNAIALPESHANRNAITDTRLQITEHPPNPPLALARGSRRGDTLTAERFETFWTAYPRKDAKKAAQRAFEKLNPDADLLGVLLNAITRHQQTRQWRDGVRPHAATWLNQERWTDEVSIEQPGTRPSTRSEGPPPPPPAAEVLAKMGLLA